MVLFFKRDVRKFQTLVQPANSRAVNIGSLWECAHSTDFSFYGNNYRFWPEHIIVKRTSTEYNIYVQNSIFLVQNIAVSLHVTAKTLAGSQTHAN